MLAALFVFVERRSADPILPLDLLTEPEARDIVQAAVSLHVTGEDRLSLLATEGPPATRAWIERLARRESPMLHTQEIPPCQAAEDMLARIWIETLKREMAFDPAELEKEKGVVIEEIAMAEDSPEDVVHELIMLSHFGDQPVARPILGTEETVSGFTREGMLTYWKNMYAPASAVLALAGNYDWNRVCELAENHLGRWDARQRSLADFRTNLVSPSRLFREKDIEQANVCLGFPGVAIGADETYEFSLINSVLGGSMSSRLFQKIREEKGMAYSIYSYPNTYTDCGMLSVYAATRPDCLKTVVDMAREEIQSLAEKGMAREEFEMAREQLKASYILGLESTASRMNAAGRRLLLLNRTRTEDEVIAQINAITFEGVNALAKRILSAPGSVALVGKDAEKLMESI